MTSNLLNCDTANGPLSMAKLFMEDNMDQLALDAAKGQGETLAALAEVIGVDAQDSAAFNRTMQSNFDSMFNADATSATAYEAMTSAMAQDAALQKYLG
jgi:ABC-type bacteriocin/lantibiotic exporter with double-glycine peptidase domain